MCLVLLDTQSHISSVGNVFIASLHFFFFACFAYHLFLYLSHVALVCGTIYENVVQGA